MRAPILALHGGAHQAITHEDNFGFEQALRDAGKEYERIEFEGACHSFFDREQEESRRRPTTPGGARSTSSRGNS